MTKEEALLRLSVVPPKAERTFWTIIMVEDDGKVWFLKKGASYTSVTERWDVFEPDNMFATETDMLMFCKKTEADFVCDGWNDMAERNSIGCIFLAVRAMKKLELV